MEIKLLVYTREVKTLSKEMQDFVVNNFDGLYVECVAPESIELAKRFEPSECLLDTGTSTYLKSVSLNPHILNKYIDEPISTPAEDGRNKWEIFDVEKQIDLYDYNVTIGELGSRAFKKLEDYPCSVTFTAYRRYIKWIEKLFGWRIYIPFTSPLRHWIDLEDQFKYGFSFVFVHLTKNLCHRKKLIKWASQNNIDVCIYAGIGTWENEFQLKKHLTKWLAI